MTIKSICAGKTKGTAFSFKLLFRQDFYSHSNWVEMGQRSIYLHLLQPEEPAIPVAKGSSRLHVCNYTSTHFITFYYFIFYVIAYVWLSVLIVYCS